jgi:hypothetical protein
MFIWYKKTTTEIKEILNAELPKKLKEKPFDQQITTFEIINIVPQRKNLPEKLQINFFKQEDESKIPITYEADYFPKLCKTIQDILQPKDTPDT